MSMNEFIEIWITKTANHNVKCRFFMSFYKLNQGMESP